MTKYQLEEKTTEVIKETRNALQMVYDALNQGQQKKIVKDEKVKALLDRYGVKYSE
jgi:hypothetical protein